MEYIAFLKYVLKIPVIRQIKMTLQGERITWGEFRSTLWLMLKIVFDKLYSKKCNMGVYLFRVHLEILYEKRPFCGLEIQTWSFSIVVIYKFFWGRFRVMEFYRNWILESFKNFCLKRSKFKNHCLYFFIDSDFSSHTFSSNWFYLLSICIDILEY